MVIPFPDVDPVLIHIWGKLAIRWYSLAYIAGLVAGWWWVVRLLRDRPLWRNPPFDRKPPATEDDIGDLLVWATLGVIVGGRLGWLIFYGTILCTVSPDGAFCGTGATHLPGDFLTHPLRIVAAWDGGMSFHGGMAGTVVAIWLFTVRRKLDFVKVGDLVASVAPIGLFFGRLANFINGELWGKVTDVPWAMVFCTPHVMAMNGGTCPAGLQPRHPSQLYEAALEGLLLFAILQIGIRKFRWHEKPGLVSAVFFLGYGLARVFVEFFREPDAPFWGPISMGQALSFPMWFVAAFFFWYALWREPRGYVSVSPLGQRIAALIAAQGPISIAQFMTQALHDPQYGYYATPDTFGKDFITAPEISQMFGELVGLWLAQCWLDQGKPSPAHLVELGPGRGTLMADALRALKAAPDFLKAIEVVLVEASPTLKAIQQEKLKDAPVKITWQDNFADTADDTPLFLVANEFFDALPIRQFVMTERGWCERMVTTDANGALTFALAPVPVPLDIPAERGVAGIGAVYETSSAAAAIMEEIARVIAAKGGAALIVDYGYDAYGGFGETFQAVGNHTFQDLLADPGAVDLTAHVDFAALARAARYAGAMPYGPQSQASFLEGLGIEGRAVRLAHANRGQAADIDAAVARLIGQDQMGLLFNALAIVRADAPLPPAFAAEDDAPPDPEAEGLVLLRADNLSTDPDIEAGFFGRQGGVSDGLYASLNCGPGSNDDRDNVIENRGRALGELAPNAALVTVHQIHSAKVVTVTEPWALGEGPQADAMVTDQREIALGILAADCAPVLFADPRARVIGAAHAGWKGALPGVTDATIEAMEALGAKRSRIAAAIGPCISQANYEVGPEFRETFVVDDPENAQFFIASAKPEHFHFDLEGYVVQRLKRARIGSVEPLSACTYARESEFFSFRRATHRGEADYGREISVIVLI